MELYKRVSMKDMLAQGLYELMKSMPYDKITIKQISNKTGVIRGTFYNHFYDKYEALEYLTYILMFEYNSSNKNIKDYSKLMQSILNNIEKEKEFFKHCFQIEGQNGFESILFNVFCKLLSDYLDSINIIFDNEAINQDLFVQINVNTIVFIIKTWMSKQPNKSAEEIYSIFSIVLQESAKDIINRLQKTQK